MTETITAYVCSKKCGHISRKTESPLVVSSGTVTAYMQPVGQSCSTGRIKPKVLKLLESAYCDLEGSVNWSKSDGVAGWIFITFENPDHCHWKQTILWINGHFGTSYPSYVPFNLIKTVEPGGDGVCPESKDDVFSGGGTPTVWINGYWGEELGYNTDVVPGDAIQATWVMYGDSEEQIYGGASYFTTDSLTGGTITAVNGEYGTEDISYNVMIEGETEVCYPSDFIEYEVGDWVVVGKTFNLIVPLKLGSYGL